LNLNNPSLIRLLVCTSSNYWQMSNFKLNYLRSAALTLLITAALPLLLSGCYTLRFYHDTDILREKPDGEISSTSMIFFDSQIGGPANIRSACPSGASMVEIEQSTLDGLTHYLSLGLYSPQTVRVWCKRRYR
jgi:hypothetical protein